MEMNCKDLEIKESKTTVKTIQFKVEITTSETKGEEVVEISISSTIEGQRTMSHNYSLVRDRVRREIVPPQKVQLCSSYLLCFECG